MQRIMISNITSKSAAPVFSVLDQKKRNGPVYVDGNSAGSGNFSAYRSLWHADIGYTFECSGNAELSLSTGVRSGTWSAIGISKQPPEAVDLFTAWLHHTSLNGVVSYTVYPGVNLSSFEQKSSSNRLLTLASDNTVHAVMDTTYNDVIIAFWQNDGKVLVPQLGRCAVTVQSDQSAIVILSQRTWSFSVADPTQKLSTVNVRVSIRGAINPDVYSVIMPQGGLAGQSVSILTSTSFRQSCE